MAVMIESIGNIVCSWNGNDALEVDSIFIQPSSQQWTPEVDLTVEKRVNSSQPWSDHYTKTDIVPAANVLYQNNNGDWLFDYTDADTSPDNAPMQYRVRLIVQWTTTDPWVEERTSAPFTN